MESHKTFDEGSTLSWKDRETLEYTEEGFTLLIWIDFMLGFFSSGRILKLESLSEWTSSLEGKKLLIPSEKKEEIKNKVL